MNKEEYVKFSNAKRLKEKGFDWKVRMYYAENGDILMDFPRNFNSDALHGGGERVSAPTQQMVCRWLREEYYIDVLPLVRHVNKFAGELPIKEYSYRIYDSEGNVRVSSRDWFRAYEKSVEAALEYCLTNLI